MSDLPKPVSRPRRLKTARTVLALMMREMQTTYGRNVGGYAWAILEPVGALAIYTIVVSYGLRIRTPSLGTNFPLFFATGFLCLAIFMSVSNVMANALRFNRQLLAYPGVEYTDALIARLLLAVLTQLTVFYIIMLGIHIGFDLSTIRDLPAILSALTLSALFGAGVGVLNCFLFSVAPLWNSAWNILTRPLFLISTIFFTFEDVPWQFRDVLWWNPIVHCVGIMRRGFYATYDGAFASPLFVILISMIPMTIGLILLHRFHSDILNR